MGICVECGVGASPTAPDIRAILAALVESMPRCEYRTCERRATLEAGADFPGRVSSLWCEAHAPIVRARRSLPWTPALEAALAALGRKE
jgi:hypothetical protein